MSLSGTPRPAPEPRPNTSAVDVLLDQAERLRRPAERLPDHRDEEQPQPALLVVDALYTPEVRGPEVRVVVDRVEAPRVEVHTVLLPTPAPPRHSTRPGLAPAYPGFCLSRPVSAPLPPVPRPGSPLLPRNSDLPVLCACPCSPTRLRRGLTPLLPRSYNRTRFPFFFPFPRPGEPLVPGPLPPRTVLPPPRRSNRVLCRPLDFPVPCSLRPSGHSVSTPPLTR